MSKASDALASLHASVGAALDGLDPEAVLREREEGLTREQLATALGADAAVPLGMRAADPLSLFAEGQRARVCR